ncbi:class III lanthionine synthetase LanKC [Streptomyces milbemycinicus]|uniref:class III lanthionine synthetase LanKC n=1 Tax=Streptomyces milbemycinicus TaxID=476552 RepID=UPI0033DE173F
MDMRYQEFCLTDPVFYDSPGRLSSEQTLFGRPLELPEGWRRVQETVWTMVASDAIRIPTQGWKAHVSAVPANAEFVLETVWTYCVQRGIAFKHLTDHAHLIGRNAKYAERGGSGKFITIYPRDDTELQRLLEDLDERLSGQPGPYILSDVRWKDGPLYIRYGGFTNQFTRTPHGDSVPAVKNADGELVPDERLPVFRVPAWAPVPGFLAPAIAARESGDAPADFPYTIDKALHFSNGGGIYHGIDRRNGRTVVLREARPHAGLDPLGRDAVERLLNERDVLGRLTGTGAAPELYEHTTCWEHHFLVQEHIDGTTLSKAINSRFPLIRAGADDNAVAEYTDWALNVLRQVEEALAKVHARDVVFGDLHPHNIMVRPDGSVVLIDFEMAASQDDIIGKVMGAPGFVPPDDRRGRARDLYALASLRLWIFYPLTMLFPLDPGKAALVADVIERRFPVPPGYARHALAELGLPAPVRDSRVHNWSAALAKGQSPAPEPGDIVASLGRGILETATPERTDRLFPGDIEQFTYGGLGLAYGAAGVLYALHRTGQGRFPEHERWLLDRLVKHPASGADIGFYTGLHGVAWTLNELGRAEDAERLLRSAVSASTEGMSLNVFDGLAGVGLNLLHFASVLGDDGLRLRAEDIAAQMTAVADAADPIVSSRRRLRGGLLHGGAGRALFLIRMFEATEETALLDEAARALKADLDLCVVTSDGSLQFDEGWRVLPYVERGSAGIGMVLREYLRLRDDPELEQALTGIRRAAEPEFIIGAGLFNGRSGLIAFLAQLRGFAGPHDATTGRDAVLDAALKRHLRGLGLHILARNGEAVVAGDQLLRLSTDLATGASGVMLTLDHLTTGRPVLPFLSATRAVTTPALALPSVAG